MFLAVFALALYLIFVFLAVFSQKTAISIYGFATTSIPSFFLYYTYNAPDVALTEIAIGSFLTLFLFYQVHIQATNHRSISVKVNIYKKMHNAIEAIPVAITCIMIFFLMIYMGYILESISNTSEYSKYYNENAYSETGISNTVTAILASYRAFDTLGETLIIAVASFGVATILKRKTI